MGLQKHMTLKRATPLKQPNSYRHQFIILHIEIGTLLTDIVHVSDVVYEELVR